MSKDAANTIALQQRRDCGKHLEAGEAGSLGLGVSGRPALITPVLAQVPIPELSPPDLLENTCLPEAGLWHLAAMPGEWSVLLEWMSH